MATKSFEYALQIAMQKKETQSLTFKPVHNRWAIETTFSWFNKDRILCRNYELLVESAEKIVKLSVINLLLNNFKQTFTTFKKNHSL